MISKEDCQFKWRIALTDGSTLDEYYEENGETKRRLFDRIIKDLDVATLSLVGDDVELKLDAKTGVFDISGSKFGFLFSDAEVTSPSVLISNNSDLTYILDTAKGFAESLDFSGNSKTRIFDYRYGFGSMFSYTGVQSFIRILFSVSETGVRFVIKLSTEKQLNDLKLCITDGTSNVLTVVTINTEEGLEKSSVVEISVTA